MTPIATAAELKFIGNLPSGWRACLAIPPAWDFALSRQGEVRARPESVRFEIMANVVMSPASTASATGGPHPGTEPLSERCALLSDSPVYAGRVVGTAFDATRSLLYSGPDAGILSISVRFSGRK